MFPKADPVPFIFWEGEYRVLLFFALSGFAIFFTLERIGSVADFIVNRVSRLFPAYWVAILLTLSFEYAGHIDTLKIPAISILANFTMLQGFLYLPAVDGVYWTLTVELGFYACMLGLWLVLGKGMARLEPMLLPWLALKWLMFYWEGMPSRVAMLLVLQFLPFFIIGILHYRIWSGQRKWLAQLPYLVAALATLLWTDGMELFLAGCGLVVIFAATLRGALRFLTVRPLLWFGAISYPLYLVHENIGFVIMLRAQALGFNRWLGFAAALCVVTLIAWLLHRNVEMPASRWITRKWKARKQPPRIDGPMGGAMGAV
tara:strand:- start:13446 stop:14393 length:948 start_codon:yes stop_codon:yes gene_type:complete